MPANFDDAAINQVIDRIASYALASGRFDSVNGHEPKSAPGSGVAFAVWANTIKPSMKSGLSATSISVIFQGRIYIPFSQIPYDAIDPKVMAATTDLMGVLSGDFDFGGIADVRYIDLLGIDGVALSAQAGYVEIDRRMYRIMTINIPITINDAFIQVAIVAVTDFSFTNGNGFTGTVANSNTTPDLSLAVSIAGLLKGVAGALTQAVAGTDYVAPNGQTFTGWIAPAVVALVDGATIPVDADDGNDFYVTLGGNRTIAAPTNPSDGQKITFEIIQDGTGSRTLTWTSSAGGFSFGSGSAPTLSTAAGATDQVAFRYSARKGLWLFLGSNGGF